MVEVESRARRLEVELRDPHTKGSMEEPLDEARG